MMPSTLSHAAPHATAQELRNQCKRFRILIMGKRNAGKTTILKRMTDSTDGIAFVRDPQGNLVDLSIIEPTAGRGFSDIENEITYPSNPYFIFHDSRGIEAGSTTEMDKILAFIHNRAGRRNLQDQLHAIWYCLPVDSDRSLSDVEMQFFECDTRGVPVIAVFTKFEWMITRQFALLRDQGETVKNAKQMATVQADIEFRKLILQRVLPRAVTYPPTCWVCLQQMHKPTSLSGVDGSSSLTLKTSQAIENNHVLEQVFATVQQNNVEVSIKAGLKVLIAWRDLPEVWARTNLAWMNLNNSRKESFNLIQAVLSRFPQWSKEWDYPLDDEDNDEDWRRAHRIAGDDVFASRRFVESQSSLARLSDKIAGWTTESIKAAHQVNIGVVTCIIAECLFWKGGSPYSHLDAALEAYDRSQIKTNVIHDVNDLYSQHLPRDPPVVMLRKLLQIVLKHRLTPS